MAPTRARQSGATARTAPSSSARRPTQAPLEYQAPTHPLNENAQRAIANLIKTHNTSGLEGHLKKAAQCVAENAGGVNEAFSIAEDELKRAKAKAAKQDHVDDAEKQRIKKLEADLEATRAKVDKMTRQMDDSMRKIIDGHHHLDNIKSAIEELARDAHTPGATQPSQGRSQRSRRRNNDDEDDNDEDEYQDFTPTDPAGGPTQATQRQGSAPSLAFKEKLDLKKDKYQSFSLKERYAKDNDYINFKRSLHDGQHPNGDGGDVPHADTWFNEGRGAPAPGVTTRSGAADDDSDDDLAIAKETISTKCPLTLQEFREPLTSRKCPHSFEKEAIESMINDPSNAVRVGGVPAANGRRMAGGERAVQCPVAGCTSMLTLKDLGVDTVLKRKIWRIQRAARMAEDDGDDARGAVQNIGSSDDEDGMDIDQLDARSARDVKRERMSTAPRRTPARESGLPRSSAMQIDDGVDEDEDEDDEDDEDDE